MIISWRWLGLWLSLGAILLVASYGSNGDGYAPAASSTKMSHGQTGVSHWLPSQPWPVQRRVPADGAAAETTTANLSYTLDPYTYIPAPWYGDEPWKYDAPTFTSTEIGDVTGDGRNDLIGIGSGVSPEVLAELLVYAQQSDGSLAAAARYPINEDNLLPAWTALGDFNEDGVSDVLVSGAKSFGLFASNGLGGFTTSTHPIFELEVELAATVPAVPMDVNGDGHLDVVFHLSRTHAGGSGFPTDETHTRMVIWFGDGLGGFAGRISNKTYGSSPYDVEKAVSIVSGDLNADGNPDLAVRVVQYDYQAQIQHQLIRVYLLEGEDLVPAYNINAVRDIGSTFSSMDYLAIGDFNHDGLNDIAGSPGSMDMRVWILRQSVTHRFDTPPMVRSTQPIGVPMRVADLDNNGLDDLLIGHDAWARVTYYMQSQQELAEPVMREFVYNAAPRLGLTSLAVGDLNGDGCADVSVAASYYGLRLLRGSNCAVRAPPMVVCRTDQEESLVFLGGPTSANVSHLTADMKRSMTLERREGRQTGNRKTQ
jgi:hypothetical protein